jgi:pyruvate kinase
MIIQYFCIKAQNSLIYRSAQLIAQYRPRAVIMAVTRSMRTARQLQLYRACCPVYVESKFYHVFFSKNLTKNCMFFFQLHVVSNIHALFI